MSDLTDDEREFMMGSGGFGRGGFNNQRRGGGMMGGFRGGRGGANYVNQNENSAAFGGRRIKIEGLEENHTDEIVMRYFRKFGVVDDWSRDKSGTSGFVDFTESYMVDYCLKRSSHQIDGSLVRLSRAEPSFDDEAAGDNEEENQDTSDNIDNVD